MALELTIVVVVVVVMVVLVLRQVMGLLDPYTEEDQEEQRVEEQRRTA